MGKPVEKVAKWFYGGLWGLLTRWFRVPEHPPALPAMAGEHIQSFKPDNGFLRYLLFQFYLGLLLLDGLLLIGWIILVVAFPLPGLVLAPVFLVVAIVPNLIAYLAVHLRYDTTWYVMSDRSLRIRRGIWLIRESTITFENIQNVSVDQGPLQRWFGIADVCVKTAGGGQVQPGAHGTQSMAAHQGLIEGVANAQGIRDSIMERLGAAKSGGLGDEEPAARPAAKWTGEHVDVLREIRSAVRKLSVRGT